MDLSEYDEEKGTTNDEITRCHPAFDCFAIAQVDEMIEKVGGNDADANLRLQAVIKLLESRKMSVDVEVGRNLYLVYSILEGILSLCGRIFYLAHIYLIATTDEVSPSPSPS